MSQAKVDKYKKEKQNREKEIKKKRVKKITGIFLAAILLGVAVGFPLGKQLYKVSVDKREAKATVKAEYVDLWMQEQWNANYSDLWNSDELSSGSDAFYDGNPEDGEIINLEDIDDLEGFEDVIDAEGSAE